MTALSSWTSPTKTPGGRPAAVGQQVDRQEVFLTARLSVAISAILAFYPSPPSPEESVLTAQYRVHIRKRVDEALAGLEEIDRRIVVRVALEDAPLTEVARELGIERYSEARRRYEGALASWGRG